MKKTPKYKKDLKKLNPLEQEQEIKKREIYSPEFLEDMGQENEKKAVPYAKKFVKEQKEIEKLQVDIEQGYLKQASNDRKLYQRYLIAIMGRYLKQLDYPYKKFRLYIESDDKGIVAGIEGTQYVGAFKVTGVPDLDANAAKLLAIKIKNTANHLLGKDLKLTKGGIYIPQKSNGRAD